jgi:hypothetical protein
MSSSLPEGFRVRPATVEDAPPAGMHITYEALAFKRELA